MERFCIYYPHRALLTLFALLLVLAAVFGWVHVPLWMVLVLELSLFLAGWYYIGTRPFAWGRRAGTIRDEQCDPYPFLQVCEKLSTVLKNPIQKQVFLMDLATSHSDIGLSEKAIEIMQAVAKQGLEKHSLPMQVVYHNNLACYYLDVNRPEEAEAALQQAATLLQQVKNQKQAEKLAQIMQAPKAELALVKGDHAGAVALSGGMSEESNRAKVSKAFLRAKIHLAMGEQAAAQHHLRYVVANANRLYCRVEAEEMLAALNA